jgi:hypothetical protein
MDIVQMHITFRELAQRMGLHTVRAIFPEDVDICLNFAIIAKTKSIIAENAQSTNDLIIKANADISQLNALRNLARKKEVVVSHKGRINDIPFVANISNDDVMFYTRFAIGYSGENVLYDCRIIEAEYLYRTLQDYCNRPTKQHPICVAVNIDGANKVEIYNGKSLISPDRLIYNYIKMPNKVKLDEEHPENNIDCDMPDYLIQEIIEIAVQYYKQTFALPNVQK